MKNSLIGTHRDVFEHNVHKVNGTVYRRIKRWGNCKIIKIIMSLMYTEDPLYYGRV